MIQTQRAFNDFIVFYFVSLVIIGAFFLINLTLAVIKAKFTDTIGRQSKEILQEGYLEQLEKLLSADQDQDLNEELKQEEIQEDSKDQEEPQLPIAIAASRRNSILLAQNLVKEESDESSSEDESQKQTIQSRRSSILSPIVKPQLNIVEKRRMSKFYQPRPFQNNGKGENLQQNSNLNSMGINRRRATVADLNFQITPVINDVIQEENTQSQNQSQTEQDQDQDESKQKNGEEEQESSQESKSVSQCNDVSCQSKDKSKPKRKFHVITELEVKKAENKNITSNPQLMNKLEGLFYKKKTMPLDIENYVQNEDLSALQKKEQNDKRKDIKNNSQIKYKKTESISNSSNSSFMQADNAKKRDLSQSSFLKTSSFINTDNLNNYPEKPITSQQTNQNYNCSTFSSTNYVSNFTLAQTESANNFNPDSNRIKNKVDQNNLIGKSKFKMQDIMSSSKKFIKYSPITTASNTPKNIEQNFLSSLSQINNIRTFNSILRNEGEKRTQPSQIGQLPNFYQKIQKSQIDSEAELSYLLEDLSQEEFNSGRGVSSKNMEMSKQNSQQNIQKLKEKIKGENQNETSDQSQILQRNSASNVFQETQSPSKVGFGLKLLQVLANNKNVNSVTQNEKNEFSIISKLIIAGQSERIKKVLQKKKDNLGQNVKSKFLVKKTTEIQVNSQEDVQNLRENDYAENLIQIAKQKVKSEKSQILTSQNRESFQND